MSKKEIEETDKNLVVEYFNRNENHEIDISNVTITKYEEGINHYHVYLEVEEDPFIVYNVLYNRYMGTFETYIEMK
jgi:hypothetical protein